jgi:hypothetical protein
LRLDLLALDAVICARMAKPKTRGQKKPQPRPLAKKVRAVILEALGRKVVDLDAFRKGRAAAATLQQSVPKDEEFAGLHPEHAAYIYVVNQVSVLCEILTSLPELDRFVDLIGRADEGYMPSWPPMSPISTSHFNTWAFFDAAVGIERETIGTIILDLAPDLPLAPGFVDLLEHLTKSRLGLYAHEGGEGKIVVLREVHTGVRKRAIAANAHVGRAGELWLARVLPPPHPSVESHVSFISPYVIESPGEAAWLGFFERNVPKVRARDAAQAFELLMKYGLGPSYWNEYIFEGYADHDDCAIWLRGLPDVAESRPHSPKYDPSF